MNTPTQSGVRFLGEATGRPEVHAKIRAPATPMPPTKPPALVYRLTMPLSLAITLLLFVQWPLRDIVGAGAQMANDIAQLLFALYVAVAVSWASVRGAHLAAHPEALERSRWRRVGAALAPLPWCGWVLLTAAGPTWNSLRQTEQFPESFSPGYFVIKLALMLLAALLAAQCVRELRAAMR